MRHAFLGEVIAAAFNVVPRGWAVCDGRQMSIDDYPDLYQLLGTTYGGDGVTTFALPDLGGRVIVDANGSSFVPGAFGGTMAYALTESELPSHSHEVRATNINGAIGTPSGNFLAASSNNQTAIYRPTNADVTLHQDTITTTGNNCAHENMQPYLVMNYYICIDGGEYPVR